MQIGMIAIWQSALRGWAKIDVSDSLKALIFGGRIGLRPPGAVTPKVRFSIFDRSSGLLGKEGVRSLRPGVI